MIKRNVEGLNKYTTSMNMETINKVNAAIDRLKNCRASINFSTVAKEAGVSKATLYNNDILKERILGLRTTTKGVAKSDPPATPTVDGGIVRGYLDEIRRLREEKKKLILQLVELETLREEIAELKAQAGKRNRKSEYVL